MFLSRTLTSHLTRMLILPAGFALATGFSPASQATPRAYVMVLKNPLPNHQHGFDHVQIINPDGVFGIPTAGFGSYIENGFITAPRASDERIDKDFSPALAAMRDILSKGLPPLAHSYAVLLENQGDKLGYLHVELNARAYQLKTAGQAMLADGYSYDPFTIDQAQLETDFGPVLKTLAKARAAGLPRRTYVVLLENPDGTSGKIMVSDERGTTTLDVAGQAMPMDPGMLDSQTFKVDEQQLRTDFGPALDARPPLPALVTLHFEVGSARLTPASKATLETLMADLRDRPVPEISIHGHTDLVGSEALNDKLSRSRAEYVASQLRTLVGSDDRLEAEAFGKRNPLVVTPDQTPEPRNRRVEVRIR